MPSLAIDHIFQLFDQSVDAGLDFLKQHSAVLSCPVPGMCAVKCLCCILDGLLRAIIEYHGGFADTEGETPNKYPEEESTSQLPHQTLAGIYIPTGRNTNPAISSKVAMAKNLLKANMPVYRQKPGSLCDLISNLFVFAYTWSFGGCFERVEQELDLDIAGNDLSSGLASEKIARGGNTAMEKFDALVYDLFSDGKISVHLPTSARLIYMYYPNIYTNTFEPLDRLISSPVQNVSFLSPGIDSPMASQRFMFRLFINPGEDTYSASSVSMVPTVDIVRLSFLISVMLESGSMPNIMVSGKSGVGKTQLLTFLSKSMASVKWRKAVIQSVLGKPQHVNYEGNHNAEEEDLRKDTDEQSFSTTFYHISTQLESQRMQSMLGSYLMRQGKSILIPPTGRNVC